MKIIVQNLALEYADRGSGELIFFLHGWMDDLHTFDRLIAELPAGYRCLALDLPGFGQSEPPPEPWQLEHYVQLVAAFLKKMELSPQVMVGHSFGGRVAIKGVASGQLQPKRLILLASAGLAKTHSLRSQLFKLAAKSGKALTVLPPFRFWRGALRQKLYASSGSDYLQAGTLGPTFLHIIREDLSEQASCITIPTLLIWGSEDSQTPLADGKRLAQLIQNAQLKVIPGAGHFVHREHPQAVAALMKDFL